MSSPAPAPPTAPAPPPAPAVAGTKISTLQETLRKNPYAGPVFSFLSRPIVYVLGAFALFCTTFGYVFILSGINLYAIDTSNLNVWWGGTIISSAFLLLIFYLVFVSGGFLTKAIIVLLLLTFIFIHISLLLTQMNLRV